MIGQKQCETMDLKDRLQKLYDKYNWRCLDDGNETWISEGPFTVTKRKKDKRQSFGGADSNVMIDRSEDSIQLSRSIIFDLEHNENDELPNKTLECLFDSFDKLKFESPSSSKSENDDDTIDEDFVEDDINSFDDVDESEESYEESFGDVDDDDVDTKEVSIKLLNKKNREEMAQRSFTFINNRGFQNKFAGNLTIQWNKRLLTCAGNSRRSNRIDLMHV